jgi:hypothetical protein
MTCEALIQKSGAQRRTFYATLLVTRVEKWSVEAETIEAARELLLSGAGDRCGVGERIHAEVEQISE